MHGFMNVKGLEFLKDRFKSEFLYFVLDLVPPYGAIADRNETSFHITERG
jgi:hypothetical protein